MHTCNVFYVVFRPTQLSWRTEMSWCSWQWQPVCYRKWQVPGGKCIKGKAAKTLLYGWKLKSIVTDFKFMTTNLRTVCFIFQKHINLSFQHEQNFCKCRFKAPDITFSTVHAPKSSVSISVLIKHALNRNTIPQVFSYQFL